MVRIVLSILLLLTAVSGPVAAGDAHEELGSIRWLRDYDAAIRQAKLQEKPVLILFQEVPGCSTCRNYGLRVLSHPLLAEAAEELFIPLAVFNNRSGEDAEVLRLFEEPSWNNPVVRIIDPDGRELTRRLAGDYSPGGFSGALIDSLEAFGEAVPEYLRVAHAELSARGREETALFAMFCFWEGEVKLGGIPGVIATRAGLIGGREVAEVRYDSRSLSYRRLLGRVARLRCADRAFVLNSEQRAAAEEVLGADRVKPAVRFRADSGTKHYLSRTDYRFLPMTESQKRLANIALYEGREPLDVLSPRQRAALQYIRRHPDYPWTDLIGSDDFRREWREVWQTAGQG